MPRVRLRVREAQPVEDPLGAGLRPVAARRTLVQTGSGHRCRRPDHRGVVPVQPVARRVEGGGGTAAEAVRRREVGFPAVLARVVGQQRRRLRATTARFRPVAVRPDTITAGRTVQKRRRRGRWRRRRHDVLRSTVRRDGDHSQQPWPLRPGTPVHILRESLLPEVRAQDSHQVTAGAQGLWERGARGGTRSPCWYCNACTGFRVRVPIGELL